jgi:hypothetical protein
MSVLSPGEIRRHQATQRRLSAQEELRQELLATQQALVASRQAERALRLDLMRAENALALGPTEDALRSAIADLAWRDREMRILRRQVAAARAALLTYQKQDERRAVPHSVAAATLALLDQEIPQEESYDQPPTTGPRRGRTARHRTGT